MGFFKSLVSVVSAPVTAPLKVASNVIDNVAPLVGLSGPGGAISNVLSAPYEVVNKGADVKDVLPGLTTGLKAATSLVADPTGATAAMSLLNAGKQPVASTTNPFLYTTNEGAAGSTGYQSSQMSADRYQQIMFYGAIAAGGLLVVFVAMRRR